MHQKYQASLFHLTLGLLALIPIALLLAYMVRYGENMPRMDQTRIAHIAVAAHTGTLTPQDLLWNLDGHPIAPSLTITALFAWLTNWNLQAEMFVNFGIAVLIYVAALRLVWVLQPELVKWCYIPLSILIFNIQQDAMWLVGLYSMWLIPTLLMFIMVNVLLSQHKWRFGIAILCAFISSYAMASGVLIWGVGLASLILLKFNWRKWLLWLIAAGVNAVLVLSLSWGSITSVVLRDVANPNQVRLQFLLGYLGNLFSFNNLTVAAYIGIGLLILGIINLIVLLRNAPNIVLAVFPIALYPIGTALIASWTRPFWYLNGEHAAFNSQYRESMAVFWIPFAIIIIANTWHLAKKAHIGGYILTLLNGLATVIASVAFILATYGVLHPSAESWNYLYRIRSMNPDCLVRFIYTQSVDEMNQPANCDVWGVEWLNKASQYNLALFNAKSPQNTLPSYTENMPVVLVEDDRWAAYNIQKWLLHDIPAEAVHIVYNAEVPLLEDAPPIQSEMFTSLDDLPPLQDSFWLVYSEFQTPPQLELDGFDVIPFTHTTPEQLTFNLLRYERFDPASAVNAPFGESITLTNWTITPALEACTEIAVRSFWTTNAPLPDGYSATLTLDRLTGESIWDFESVARTDRQLTLTPTEQWQEGERYLDERTLTIPCDLTPGEYRLRMGVYNYRDNKLLPTDDTELGLLTLAELSL